MKMKRTLQLLPVDCVNGHNSISSHIRMAVFQTRSDGWHQRLQQFGLLKTFNGQS